METVKKTAVILLMLCLPLVAEAYIGPGMSGGLIALVLGILATIFIGFFAICWYPIKLLFKKKQKPPEEEPKNDERNQS